MPIRRDEWVAASFNRPLYQQRRSEPFWFDYLEDSETLYFKYNAARDPLGKEGHCVCVQGKTRDSSTETRPLVDSVAAYGQSR